MKLNKWRIGVKAIVTIALIVAMSAFEKLVHPVLSAQAAVTQLADTPESSAQMAGYGWVIPVGWTAISIVAVMFVSTEALAIARANKQKEADR